MAATKTTLQPNREREREWKARLPLVERLIQGAAQGESEFWLVAFVITILFMLFLIWASRR